MQTIVTTMIPANPIDMISKIKFKFKSTTSTQVNTSETEI
jgi:hypothetical protein